MQDLTARTIELFVVLGTMAVLAVALLSVSRPVLAALRRAGVGFVAALLGVAASSEVLVWLWVPRALLDMNHHGAEVWSAVTRDLLLDLGNAEHGPAHLLSWRLLQPWLPEAMRPWGAGHVLAALSVVLVGLLTWRLTGRRVAGLLAAVVLGFAPFHLRLAPSLSGYGAWETWSLLSACGLVAWRGTGWARFAVVAGAAGVLAASTRADGMLFLPAMLAVVGLAAPGPSPVRWRSLLAGSPFVLLWLGRVGRALSNPDEPLDPARLFVAHLPSLAAVSAVLLAVVLVGRRLPRVPAGRGLLLVTLGTLALTEGAMTTFDGRWPVLPGGVDAITQVHPLLHPLLLPTYLLVPALVGLALLARRSLPAALVLVVLEAFATFLHFVVVGEDSVSFYVRNASALGWGLAALAGVGLSRAGEGRSVPALWALVVVGVVVSGREGFLRHAWPTQQEASLLFGEADDLPSGSVIHYLAQDDLVLPVTGDDLQSLRPDVAGWMSHDNRLPDQATWLPVADALADPQAAVGSWWWQGLACVQATVARRGGRLGAGSAVYAAGRIWAYDPDDRVTAPPPHPELAPWLDLAVVPCITEGGGRCAVEADGACLVWACDDPPRAPTVPYMDPLCRAMHERFVLEPAAVVEIGAGSLDSDRFIQLDPHAVVGLYRITALKSP